MPPRIPKESAFETLILTELGKINEKVDRSLEQGRENSEDLKILRKELGIDGAHGRLPIVEAAQADHEKRIAALEVLRVEANARHKLLVALIAALSGGAGGTLIGVLAHIFGIK
jgi:hypothetical protein